MAKKPRPGVFRPGPDPRRHVFTPEQRKRGGQTRGRQLLADMHHHVYNGHHALADAADVDAPAPNTGALFDNSPEPQPE